MKLTCDIRFIFHFIATSAIQSKQTERWHFVFKKPNEWSLLTKTYSTIFMINVHRFGYLEGIIQFSKYFEKMWTFFENKYFSFHKYSTNRHQPNAVEKPTSCHSLTLTQTKRAYRIDSSNQNKRYLKQQRCPGRKIKCQNQVCIN